MDCHVSLCRKRFLVMPLIFSALLELLPNLEIQGFLSRNQIGYMEFSTTLESDPTYLPILVFVPVELLLLASCVDNPQGTG